MIKIYKKDESTLFINCEHDEALNIQSYFSFYAPNYVFHPKYKMHVWDGKIRLFNINKCELPIGLYKKLITNLDRDGISYGVMDTIFTPGKKISTESVLKFASSILKTDKVPRDYQINAVQHMLYGKKKIILSATASGKSFIAFLFFNLLKYMYPDYKFLLVVPTIQLVEQMYEDFKDYGKNFADYDKYVHRIYAGKDKNTDKPITISTWQSLQRLEEKYFEQFDCVLIDECHGATGKELTKIVTNSINAEYKIGMSGTLNNAKADELQLEALFSNIIRVNKTIDLINAGHLSNINIHALILKYPEKYGKFVKGLEFDEECKFINSQKVKRNFVCSLANSRENNTLILFKHREYGTSLYRYLESKSKKKIFYVDGTVSVEYRENVRKYCEENNDVIIVASYGTFSTGINIKNLHNIIFGESIKSMIKVIQSIGRGLRKHVNKNKMYLFDICDDMSYKKHNNTLLNHFLSRIEYYDAEEFTYKVKEYNV